MSGKNLLLKFFGVLVLVGLSLGALWGYRLKMGQDIAGGTSMIFEVYNEDKSPKLVEDIIANLKKRIDPTGNAGLEWRPLKNNRFEVRMPATSEEAQTLRKEYLDARDALLDNNIERSEIRALLPLSGKARTEAVSKLTGPDTAQAKCVEDLLASMGVLVAAEKKLQTVNLEIQRTKSNRPKLLEQLQKRLIAARDEVADAATEYRKQLETVREGNIDPHALLGLLKLYDEARAQENKDKQAASMVNFNDHLEDFTTKYAPWKGEVEKVVDLYKQWTAIRRGQDPSDLRRMIKKAGVLEFRIAPPNPQQGASSVPEAKISQYVKNLDTEGPEALREAGGDYAWYPIYGDDEGYDDRIVHDYAGKRYVLLSNKPNERLGRSKEGEEKWKLKSARVGQDELLSPAVDFRFDETGAKLFTRLTSNNLKKKMAVLLDDEVYSAPVIQSTISDRGQISGKFTLEEVKDLVRILNAGSLAGKINPDPISETNFGPAIGEVNLQKGFRAAIMGMVAVACFMMIYYLLCGAIADVALLLNMILVLGAMSLFRATLTLPGIAGLILTIGMAVDANVLIFERLREEQAKGLPIRQAMKNAYERAFTAIFDANITTLLICLFLYVVFDWVGMEAVRGFAITLGLGVTFSMFTALLVTRWIFQGLMNMGLIKNPLPMLRLIPKFNINWMAKRHLFWGISIVMVVLGIGSLLWQGRDILGIEFSSGTQATLKFRDDALIDGQLLTDGLVRTKLESQASQQNAKAEGDEKKTLDKLIATARVETLINENYVFDFLKPFGEDATQITLAQWKDRKRNIEFFKLIDTDDNGVLTTAELQAKLPQTSYQVTTTVTDSKLVRKTANVAFGRTLQRRLPCTFTLVKGKMIPQMGVTLSTSGRTWITPRLMEGVTADFRDELLDYDGGILQVVRNVNPVIDAADLRQRIRDIRMQPDFGRQAINPYKVIGLTPATGGDGYTSFAVLVRPAMELKTKTGRTDFVDAEQAVLTNALQREDAMVLLNFDAGIAGETAQLAVVAVILSWLAIVVYLWLRFGSVQWGLAAVVCLVHDVIIVVGLVAVSGWVWNTALGQALGMQSFKIDLAMVAALLTVIGYSVNDTIVVFDRIRENRGKLKTVSHQVINASINQTLPRTLLTSFTTFLVVFIMYAWGGPGIKSFSYALLMGIIFGTYSSVAVASPLLLGFKQALVARTTGIDVTTPVVK
jgi:SecD/SecF fusion protein